MNSFLELHIPGCSPQLFSPKEKLHLHFTGGEFYIYPVGSAGRTCERHPPYLVWHVCLQPFFTLITSLLPSPPRGSEYHVCHKAAVYPVHGKVQLPQREVSGNPVVALALEVIICSHSNIPAKQLCNMNLESDCAAVCEDHWSPLNYYLKSLRTF